MAAWLNTAFAGYDKAILSVMHFLSKYLGFILTPLMKVVTFLGEKGIIFFLLALCFMCFKKTRRLGVCIFGAVCCGALITNVILKDAIARTRPFETFALYKEWWIAVGSPFEDGYSFPSGHVTAAAAGMSAIYFIKGRKYLVPGIVVIIVMAVARNYLMAHYPSDVLFAVVIGIFSGYVAMLITDLIFNFLKKREDSRICAAVLEFDLPVQNLSRKLGVSTYQGKHDKK